MVDLHSNRENFIEAGQLHERLNCELDNSHDFPMCSTVSKPASPTRSLLLIDLRSMFLFQEGHVRNSVNLTNCELISKRVRDGKLRIMEYLESRVLFTGSQDIVIYEHGDEQAHSSENGLELTEFGQLIFNNLRESKFTPDEDIKILKGGFDSFRNLYPKHCTQGVKFVRRVIFVGCNDDESTYLNWEATKIRDNIYIGALHDAKNDELLEQLGITHILNCSKTDSRDHDKTGKYEYLKLDCEDNLKQSLAGKLRQAFDFIDGALSERRGKVLIHCYAGVSRSAAITIAYLIKRFNMTYEQAYCEVKEQRKIVSPNLNFVAQLKIFEAECLSNNKRQRMNDSDIEMTPCDDVPTNTADVKSCPMEDITESVSSGSGMSRKFNVGVIERDSGVNKSSMVLKRKLTSPSLRLQLPIPKPTGVVQRFGNIASAPILAPGNNPFTDAFRQAMDSKQIKSNSAKLESVSE